MAKYFIGREERWPEYTLQRKGRYDLSPIECVGEIELKPSEVKSFREAKEAWEAWQTRLEGKVNG